MTAVKQPAVYMMASRRNGTLCVGVTSDLIKRVSQHRNGTFGGFTSQYGCTLLVWFELHATMNEAILREKRIKGGSRADKLALIENANSTWSDRYQTIV